MSPKLRVGLGALLISLCLDLLTKHLVLTHLHFGDKKPIIEGFFYLTHVRNPGAAFGLFATAPAELRLTFFIGISVLAIVVILSYYHRLAPGDRLSALALGMSRPRPLRRGHRLPALPPLEGLHVARLQLRGQLHRRRGRLPDPGAARHRGRDSVALELSHRVFSTAAPDFFSRIPRRERRRIRDLRRYARCHPSRHNPVRLGGFVDGRPKIP
jgi:hypothetical protein